MKFWEKHAADRERFTIVAIHDSTAKDFAELDRLLAEQGTLAAWGGRTLPFPVLLDTEGRTVKRWGIWAFPTTVLIDPEGNLQLGDLAALERALAAPAPAPPGPGGERG